MNIKCLYRISDSGNLKTKLDGATKMHCLDNFLKEFPSNVYVFADNCSNETIMEIKMRGIEPYILSLGNSESWRYIVEYAINNFEAKSYVYLVEDDYLHLKGSASMILEGLEIADYVSLYDHPDKYIDFKLQGANPYIKEGGNLLEYYLLKVVIGNRQTPLP